MSQLREAQISTAFSQISVDTLTEKTASHGVQIPTGIFAQYQTHPTFTANTQIIDKEYADNLVNNSAYWTRVTNATQSPSYYNYLTATNVGDSLRINNDSTSYAKYSTSINLDWGQGTLTGTAHGGAAISGGWLDLAHGDTRYVTYSAVGNANTLVNQWEIVTTFKPNYSDYPPAGTQYLIPTVYTPNGLSPINAILLAHTATAGHITCYISNSTGGEIINNYIATSWAPVSGTTYEIRLTYNNGVATLRINGTTVGTLTGSGSRSSNITNISVGTGYDAYASSNASFKNMVLYPFVKTYADYTFVDDAISSLAYFTIQQNLKGMNIPEYNFLISSNTIAATNTNGDLILTPNGTGSVKISTLTTSNGIMQTSSTGAISSSTALPNGTTATTQTYGDNSTKLATTAFVASAVGGEDFWDRAIGSGFPNTLYSHNLGDAIQLYVNASCYASYASSVNLIWGQGVLFGSAVGGAGISNGWLDATGGSVKYIAYNGAGNFDSLIQTFEIRISFKPNYSGTPAATQWLMPYIYTANGSYPKNAIAVAHASSTGYITCRITDSAGTTDLMNGALTTAWSPVSGTEYELCLTCNATTGAVVLRINGATAGTYSGTPVTRSNDIQSAVMGSDNTGSATSNASFRKLVCYPSIRTIADYTPSSLLFSTTAYTTIWQDVYGLRLVEQNLIITPNNITSTDPNGVINLIPNGTGTIGLGSSSVKVGIGTLSPSGRLHTVLDDLNGSAITTWTGRMAVFGEAGSTGKGTLIGFDVTNSAGAIAALKPAVAWYPINLGLGGGAVFGNIYALDSGYMFQGPNSSSYKAKAYSWDTYSCSREFKKDIVRISDAINLLDIAEGVSFTYNYPEDHKFNDLNGNKSLVIPADDLRKVELALNLPTGTLVGLDKDGKHNSINQTNLIPIMWEMIRALAKK